MFAFFSRSLDVEHLTTIAIYLLVSFKMSLLGNGSGVNLYKIDNNNDSQNTTVTSFKLRNSSGILRTHWKRTKHKNFLVAIEYRAKPQKVTLQVLLRKNLILDCHFSFKTDHRCAKKIVILL